MDITSFRGRILSILVDFYVTVAMPLGLAAMGLLWTKRKLGNSRFDGDWAFIAWGWLLFICAFTIINPTYKLMIAQALWSLLSGICGLVFIFALIQLGAYVKEGKQLAVVICIAMLVFTAASSEHFLHQSMNAHNALAHRGVDFELWNDR